jgi:hypothetical protein
MSTATPITDHAEIRRWVEANNGRPACVQGTGKDEDPGMLRIDFDERDETLKEIPWDRWFEWFDKNDLALLRGDDSRFNKLVSRKH